MLPFLSSRPFFLCSFFGRTDLEIFVLVATGKPQPKQPTCQKAGVLCLRACSCRVQSLIPRHSLARILPPSSLGLSIEPRPESLASSFLAMNLKQSVQGPGADRLWFRIVSPASLLEFSTTTKISLTAIVLFFWIRSKRIFHIKLIFMEFLKLLSRVL